MTVAESLRPQRMFDFFVAHRARLGLVIYPAEKGVTGRLAEAVEKGAVVPILGDRDLKGTGVEIEFFGEPVTFPRGAASVALRTGVPLLFAGVRGMRLEDGRWGWAIEISEPLESPPADDPEAVDKLTAAGDRRSSSRVHPQSSRRSGTCSNRSGRRTRSRDEDRDRLSVRVGPARVACSHTSARLRPSSAIGITRCCVIAPRRRQACIRRRRHARGPGSSGAGQRFVGSAVVRSRSRSRDQACTRCLRPRCAPPPRTVDPEPVVARIVGVRSAGGRDVPRGRRPGASVTARGNRSSIGPLRRLAVRTAVSDAARELVARYFPGDYQLTPNGVDLDGFVSAEPADLGDGHKILFLGRLERRKGLEVLIQAMTRLRELDVELIVAGAGPQEKEMRALADRLLVPARFLGRVDDEAKASLFNVPTSIARRRWAANRSGSS